MGINTSASGLLQLALCDKLDKRLNDIIEEYRPTSGLVRDTFNGTVAGFLLKTGVRIALVGMSRQALQRTVNNIIDEAVKG